VKIGQVNKLFAPTLAQHYLVASKRHASLTGQLTSRTTASSVPRNSNANKSQFYNSIRTTKHSTLGSMKGGRDHVFLHTTDKGQIQDQTIISANNIKKRLLKVDRDLQRV
jgi:hypothetical protein